MQPSEHPKFADFEIDARLIAAVTGLGFDEPTPIQVQAIPDLLRGHDIIGRARTGSGKTAAFGLPLLERVKEGSGGVQALVLTPTRELAVQVTEALRSYATKLPVRLVTLYGGVAYGPQLSALRKGVSVVVGTPGRVLDHMHKGTLDISALELLVLDEADEMLRMGFIDDVEWILEQTPEDRQIALFSATMPQQIRRIAEKYLNNPEQITIKTKTTTVDTIRQRFWPVSGVHKLDALTRILEAEDFDAMIIFVRTKNSTVELAEKLEARGYAAAAINGDIQQNLRERTIENLKNGKLDILIATDVAARGLDVKRISHVVNYDIPSDTESYVHRIGRTGRAGRTGDAILFVAPREKRLLNAIEKATRKPIEIMELPSTELINDQRIVKFKQRITDTLATEELGLFYQMIEQYQQEHNVPALEIAAALAQLIQGDTPFLLQNKPAKRSRDDWDNSSSGRERPQRKDRERSSGKDRERSSGRDRERSFDRERAPGRDRERSSRKDTGPAPGMQSFRIEVGHDHEVKPGNIVGAIANEAGIDSKFIGHIKIENDYSLVDLPADISNDALNALKKVWVSGKQLNISRLGQEARVDKSDRRQKVKAGSAKTKETGSRVKDPNAKAKSRHKNIKDKGKGRKKIDVKKPDTVKKKVVTKTKVSDSSKKKTRKIIKL